MDFPAELNQILKRLDSIDPVAYAATRNYVNGAVTGLSPYISRGVVSTRMVFDRVRERGFTWHEVETLIRELAWRDYFQRVWQVRDVDEDLRQPQSDVERMDLPAAVTNAETGITGIDEQIRRLHQTGYMHNHVRMYVAALVCNHARCHWRTPAQWMYYHLLDGDWASNACSWQWVAGSNSNKKYYANQENINRYTGTAQAVTFLDCTYEELSLVTLPSHFKESSCDLTPAILPPSDKVCSTGEKVMVYNYYNLDPEWRKEEEATRVLLLEPSKFRKYPVAQKCIDFAMELSKNIQGIKIFTGEFDEMVDTYKPSAIMYKEHPLNREYSGIVDDRDWLVPELKGYYPSFFSWWKKAEKHLKTQWNKV